MEVLMRAALSGLRVIELAQGVAGSYCGKLFADLGSDVVKIEPADGDPVRHANGYAGAETAPAFMHYNTNKRSMVLAADSGVAADQLWSLLAHADLVIESRGHGALADFGLTWEAVHERRPELVVVALSGFGATGPYRDYLSSDIVEQAMSGTMLLQDTGQVPLRLPAHLGSCFTGNIAAVGALGALALVAAGGPGRVVDCSAVEGLATMPSRATFVLTHQYRGGAATDEVNANTETLIPTGVFPCADGYVGMMSTPQQLTEMLQVIDNPELTEAFSRPDAFVRPETKEILDAALYPWLFSHTRAEATAAAQAAGWPLAGVNSPAEVLAADHLHQRGFWVHSDDSRLGPTDLPGQPHRLTEGGWRFRRAAPELGEHTAEVQAEVAEAAERTRAARPVRHSETLPLEGVRVLDLTTVWSGPFATMLLADLGAEVIRIENPFVLPPTTKGYSARPTSTTNLGRFGSGYANPVPGRPDRPWNRHAMNNSTARNKLSATIDIRRPEGKELLMQLCEKADVFIENLKSYSLARMGISVSEMQARNPKLIILRLPPTGLSGDWAHYTGFGAQFDGLSGLLWICGHRDSDLTPSPATTYMDAATGPAAAFTALAALRYREDTGRGQVVELAQSENIINHLGEIYLEVQNGIEAVRMGNRDADRAPQGLYAGLGDNRWLAVSVGTDSEFAALATVIGAPELISDPRYLDVAARAEHHDELDELIGSWVAQHDITEAFHQLQAAGVPAAPLMDDTMFDNDPHIQARGWVRPLAATDVGTYRHPSHAYAGVPQAWRRGSPALGEDNEYVYKKILGVSDEDYARYSEMNLLAEDYLAPDGTPL
jgi:crotonobetainyl-CoA:carnitine CoA-transferase CaiB-like acyl-CoA transferase